MKIAMTSVFVDDPVRAFRFYTETLGFVEKLFVPDAKLAIVVSPEDPDGPGLLLEPNDNPLAHTFQEGLRKAGIPVMVLGAADVRAEVERLRALGVVITQEPKTTEWGTMAVFDDTCGNLMQLHQP